VDSGAFSNISGDLPGMLIDLLLLVGFAMLWFSWYRNGKRQQQLERLLLETAGQLDAATRHLEETSRLIEQLKSERNRGESVRSEPGGAARSRPVQRSRGAAATPQPVAESSASLPDRNSTQATMILRMNREGECAETIADRLDLPLAQVKLLLKLHAPHPAE